ncbi:hypothetical protein Tco_0879012 [Tanacetum coccineum]
MDDEPMRAVDRVVAPTSDSVITIPETANEFVIKGSSNSDTDKIMARMDAMSMKMDAQYKDFQSRSKQSNLDDDDIPMSREEEAKFIQTFRRTLFYNDYRDRDSNHDNWRSSGRNDYTRDHYQSHYDDKPDLQKQLSDFIKAQHSTNLLQNTTWNAEYYTSGKSYDPLDNPNEQNNSETPINFDSDDEDDEPIP